MEPDHAAEGPSGAGGRCVLCMEDGEVRLEELLELWERRPCKSKTRGVKFVRRRPGGGWKSYGGSESHLYIYTSRRPNTN